MSEREKEPAPPITAERFAELIFSMNRLMGRLSGAKMFREAGIGLSEWSALNLLARGDASNGALARDLGLTKQRINQIVEDLKREDYVAVGQNAKDGRANVITLTATGRTRLEGLNGQITPLLESGLSGSPRSLESAVRNLRRLSRLMKPVPTQGAE
jgi:DNA-binding MarR family transcriptional regulator